MTPKSTKTQLILVSAILVLLIAAAFEPLRHNGFVNYDDVDYVTENPHIQSGLTWPSVRWAFGSGFAANWHPLTWLSHMIDIELFGLVPFGHHMHSLLLHTLSTVLFFWLLSRMTGAIWPSAFAAVVFAIHPLRVESIAWASERKDVLCALFWMLTLLAYLYYVKKGGILRYLLVILCFALGLMSKPMIVTLPLVLLVLDFWPLERIPKIDTGFLNLKASIIPLIMEKIPLFILALISCIITILVQQHGKSITTSEEFPFVFRILNAVTSYAEYIYKMIWPKNLAVLYPFPEAGVNITYIAIAFAAISLITAYVFSQRTHKPYLITGWLWYIITLIPVIGLIHVGAQRIADRYTYVPSIGLSLMAAWFAAQYLWTTTLRKIIVVSICGIIVTLMFIATRTQLSYWQDSFALYEHTLAITSDNCIIENNLASELLYQKQYEEAYEHAAKSLSVWPENPWANANMAAIMVHLNRPEEAMAYIRKTLEAEPQNSDAWWHQGQIFEMLQKDDQAIEAYEQCLQYDSEDAEAWNNLGVLKARQGFHDKAGDCFRQAVKLKPAYMDANRNLAVFLQSGGRVEEAADCYRGMLKTNPGDYSTCYALAVILAQSGKLSESIDYYHRTLKIKPDYGPALNDMAWILAAAPDNLIRNPDQAIQSAQKATEGTGFKNPFYLDTLAVAYAAGGRFNEAMETAQTAIDLANACGQADLALRIEKRLQLYQVSRAYYDPAPKQ